MPTETASTYREVDNTAAIVPLLWAKTAPDGYHPLLCHLLDVAAVAEALWERAVGPAAREAVASGLELSDADAGRWVALLAGLHDLGKASPCFQRKSRAGAARLAGAGLTTDEGVWPLDEPHGAISAVALQGALTALGLDASDAERAATVVGGHHGTFPRVPEQEAAERAGGGRAWQAVRRELVRQVVAALGIAATPRPRALPEGVAIWLAGFVAVADWIGSNEAIFRPRAVAGRDPAVDPAVYFAEARQLAAKAMAQLGWVAPAGGAAAMRFADLFDVPAPNPMQHAVIDLGERIEGPCLVVIEAETGSGKTEAALWLADQWGRRDGRTGVYVALPTRATSDQMFSRVRSFLGRRYGDETVNLQLLHGLAGLSAEFGELRRLADLRLGGDAAAAENLHAPAGVAGQEGDDGAPANVVAAEWFTHRKRGLLSPFGVGTIDQALLAVLQTRHHCVRLSGLAGKTVVFDEVHAYDVYMSTLLEQLLRWLAALGTSVLLLSATLPAAQRAALLAAYQEGLAPPKRRAGAREKTPLGPSERSVPAYPRLSWVSREGADAAPIRPADEDRRETEPRRVAVEWVDGELPAASDDPFHLGERLRAELDDGGCAAVICNTVHRAQKVYEALRRSFGDEAVFLDGEGDGGPVLELLHARFRYRDRQEREHRALARFGKKGDDVVVPDGPPRPVSRPWRAVLVATQVIEQSLDLDFDLLVTDLAPIDLILQRMGRLHRHEGRRRPALLKKPRLWVCRPPETDGVPDFDERVKRVYAPHLLLRSWLELRRLAPVDRGEIAVPADVEDLIEDVYGERDCPQDAPAALQELWEKTRERLDRTRDEHRSKARELLVRSPGRGNAIFDDRSHQLIEDDPSVHENLQALTRLGPPTVDVVCLTPEERERLLPTGRPTVAQALELLRHSVAIGDPRVYGSLVDCPVPAGWKASALVRHHRLIKLDETGSCGVGNEWVLRNKEDVGLVVERAAH